MRPLPITNYTISEVATEKQGALGEGKDQGERGRSWAGLKSSVDVTLVALEPEGAPAFQGWGGSVPLRR